MRFLAACLLLFAGCRLDLANGVLLCNHQGKACPDGYHCAGDDYCYRNGTDPDLSLERNDASEDLAIDLSQPDDLVVVKHQGDPCTPAVDICDTGHCVDGYCCDGECTESCGACDVIDKLGTCSPVAGPSHGSRSCNGSGTCGGTCGGSVKTCSYPAASVICGPSCNGNCDGAGACSASGGGSCPNGFACGSNACLTACSQPADCQPPNFICQAPNCVRVPESDCLDGLDNNGDGKVDCDDPTCTTVTCVTAPGFGNELGILAASSCPGGGYSIVEPQHQGLSTPECAGCGCTGSISCSLNGKLYYDTSGTCGSVSNISYSPSSSGACVQITARKYYAYQASTATQNNASCAASGGASLPDPAWTLSKTFCGLNKQSTGNCGGDATKVCVPKLPAATTLCVRVPGTSGSCPGGYTGGTSDLYYSSYAKGSCGSCTGCGVASSSCPLDSAYLYSDSNCMTWIGATYALSESCYNQLGFATPTGISSHTVGSINYINGNATLTCTAPSVTTNYSMPTGGSLICCLP